MGPDESEGQTVHLVHLRVSDHRVVMALQRQTHEIHEPRRDENAHPCDCIACVCCHEFESDGLHPQRTVEYRHVRHAVRSMAANKAARSATRPLNRSARSTRAVMQVQSASTMNCSASPSHCGQRQCGGRWLNAVPASTCQTGSPSAGS